MDLQFPALFEGILPVQVGCYSDCWIGSDKTATLRLTVKKATKIRQATKPAPREASSDEEDAAQATDEEGTPEGEENNRSDGDVSEGEEEDDDEYDSEETGELETGTDEEESAETDAVEQ